MVDNLWLARQLMARGLASEAQLKVALAQGDDLGETLVATHVVKELDLLRLLSLHYKTQYITRAKLLAAKVPEWVLGLLSEEFCTRYSVLPVRFDSDKAILSLLLLDPSDQALLDAVRWEVQKKRPVRQVRPFVSLTTSIQHATDVFFRGAVPEVVPSSSGQPASAQTPDPPDLAPPFQDHAAMPTRDQKLLSLAAPDEVATPPPPARDTLPTPQMTPGAVASMPADEARDEQRQQALEEMISTDTPTPIVPIEELRAGSKAAIPFTAVEISTLLRLTRILVWLWENRLGWRNEHSLRVARLCRKIGRQAGLTGRQLNSLRLAALLHELGQPTTEHMTTLALRSRPGHQKLGRRTLQMLSELLTAAKMPEHVARLLRAQFEMPGGGGVPGLLSGDAIPLEVNILSTVDAYFDLLDNPGAPGGRCKDKDEALVRLREAADQQTLCPLAVELLVQVVSSAGLRDRILGELFTVMLVDPQRSAHQELARALGRQRAELRAVVDPARALSIARRESVDLVLMELDLEPVSGLALLRRIRSEQATKEIPVLLLVGGKARSDQLAEARGLGVLEVVHKPYSVKEMMQHIQPLIAGRGSDAPDLRRVSGSLSELPLKDMLRDLAGRKKSGRLSVHIGREKGEVRLQDGKVVDARFAGKEGEEAFQEMLGLTEGDFAIDPISFARDPLRKLGDGGSGPVVGSELPKKS